MKVMKFAAVLIALGLFSGCGTATRTSEQQENEYYEKAVDALKKGDCQVAVDQLNGLFIYTKNNRIRQLFKENANAESCVVDVYTSGISAVTSISRLNNLRYGFNKLSGYQLISEKNVADINILMEKNISEKVINGTLSISFDDAINDYYFLKRSNIMDVIAINTINNYKTQTYTKNGLDALVAYVGSTSSSPKIRKIMKDSLPLMNLKANELIKVESIDPLYVSQRLKESTMKAFVDYKSIDRLTAEDIDVNLKKSINGIEWAVVSTNVPNVITIEKVKHAEVVSQQRSQTVSYADYQVDRMAAVLFMPRNASYSFELVSNEISIDYGYVISYKKNGQKISEEIVRGIESYQNNKCQNQRITNVFGGNQPADFIANDDMRSKCSGYAKSMDSLRSDVYLKIVEKVMNIQDVKKVHAMN